MAGHPVRNARGLTGSPIQVIPMTKNKSVKPKKAVNRARHEFACKICKHAHRANIETDFISWKRPQQICEEYSLVDRTTIYRHAWATGLMEKRRRNVRAALESIIERAHDVEVTAAAVVQAVAAYARLNSEGRLVERSERVDLNQLFERMSQQELQTYAESGKLPDWFEGTVGQIATPVRSLEGENGF